MIEHRLGNVGASMNSIDMKHSKTTDELRQTLEVKLHKVDAILAKSTRPSWSESGMTSRHSVRTWMF